MQRIHTIGLVAIGLCVLMRDGWAQARVTYRVGLSAGVNAAQIYHSGQHTGLLWRYNAGLALEQRFSPALALSYQLLYSQQGSRFVMSSGSVFITNFDYINLPVLLRFRPRGERAFVQLGGQVGYLLRAQRYTLSATRPRDPWPYQYVNSVDAGLLGVRATGWGGTG